MIPKVHQFIFYVISFLNISSNAKGILGACACSSMCSEPRIFQAMRLRNKGHSPFLHREYGLRGSWTKNPLLILCTGTKKHTFSAKQAIGWCGDPELGTKPVWGQSSWWMTFKLKLVEWNSRPGTSVWEGESVLDAEGTACQELQKGEHREVLLPATAGSRETR